MLTIKRLATCSTRDGSQGTYITFASAMRIRQPTLALKPRGDVTRNPKQGYQWPQNRTCVCVRQKYLKKKKKFWENSSDSKSYVGKLTLITSHKMRYFRKCDEQSHQAILMEEQASFTRDGSGEFAFIAQNLHLWAHQNFTQMLPMLSKVGS